MVERVCVLEEQLEVAQRRIAEIENDESPGGKVTSGDAAPSGEARHETSV